MDLRVDLRLNANRHIAGVLKGYDQFLNIVLDNAIEIVSKDEKRELGTIVIRGNSVVMWENLDKVLWWNRYLQIICIWDARFI